MKTYQLISIALIFFVNLKSFSQDISTFENNEMSGGNAIQVIWLGQTFQSKTDPTVKNTVGQFNKLEVGFNIPNSTSVQIDRFLKGGNGINPFDPQQIDFKVILTDPNGKKITRYAFYYKPFITDLEKDVFIEDTTKFPWRFRFAPQLIGVWKMDLELVVGKNSINQEALTFECIESNQKGVLQTTNSGQNSDRWLKYSETNEPFFAITNNISSGGFYGYIPSQNRRQMDGVQQLIDANGNFTRFELSAQGALPDWPVYNNYKGKFDEMYAFDQLIDLCG
jgi:hypothetical protein